VGDDAADAGVGVVAGEQVVDLLDHLGQGHYLGIVDAR
jgi:hypothetical protein